MLHSLFNPSIGIQGLALPMAATLDKHRTSLATADCGVNWPSGKRQRPPEIREINRSRSRNREVLLRDTAGRGTLLYRL